MNKFLRVIFKILISLLIGIGILFLLVLLIIGVFTLRYYLAEKEFEKYDGHGFDYMHGYSSTDFTGYHVYDGEKLVSLDEPATFIIDKEEDMPILDGAEACYPVYSALAKHIYKDIDKIEARQIELDKKEFYELSLEEKNMVKNNGKIVTFTNTVRAYDRLVDHSVDLVFGARPSSNQKEYAKSLGEELISIPIGREAFVFFVEEDNPVDNLSSDEARGIYHGDITNWSEVGGKNQEIIAFQRPEDSGSQAMMKYFMQDVSLKEPDTIEMESAMGGVLKRVKQYHNERGALGYTFNYFLTGLNQEKGVKILSIDGVYPSIENIKNGSYPIVVDLVCIKRGSNTKESVDKVIDYLLSKEGQEIIEKTGYAPLGIRKEPIKENEADPITRYENDKGEAIELVNGVIRYSSNDIFLIGENYYEDGYYHAWIDTKMSDAFYMTANFSYSIEDSIITIKDVEMDKEYKEYFSEFPKPGEIFSLVP